MERSIQDAMELVSGLLWVVPVVGKAGAGEMKLGLEFVKCKVRSHSCRGVVSGL